MKRLIGLLTAIMIIGSLSGFFGAVLASSNPGLVTPTPPAGDTSGAAAPAAGGAAGSGTPTTTAASEICGKIFADSSLKSVDSSRQCTPDAEGNIGGGNNEIIVILGESIGGSSGEYSCGQIMNCLREKYKTQKSGEGFATCDLQKDYSQCVVSGKDGLSLLSNYASQVYNWIAGIVGSICILVIIISGIQISIGGLSQEEVSSAKDRVVRALSGLVVLFLSAFILYTINPFFFV
jgi:hypothetical protein